MTEDEALGWIEERFDGVVIDRLRAFSAMVIEENARQNLISPASIPSIWSRHVVDSLQLVSLAPLDGAWMDIGTGGGFPGLVVAIARDESMTLVEPRRRRAEFLQQCADQIGLAQVRVEACKVERVNGTAAVISARAVATVENLLRAAKHCATPTTRWLLPRGSIDRAELSAAVAAHRMVFHVEHSLTHADSSIVILEAR